MNTITYVYSIHIELSCISMEQWCKRKRDVFVTISFYGTNYCDILTPTAQKALVIDYFRLLAIVSMLPSTRGCRMTYKNLEVRFWE